MKRNFLKLRSWAVIALIGSFTFTSCSDDDDNGGSGDGNEDEIVMENIDAFEPASGWKDHIELIDKGEKTL